MISKIGQKIYWAIELYFGVFCFFVLRGIILRQPMDRCGDGCARCRDTVEIWASSLWSFFVEVILRTCEVSALQPWPPALQR